MPDTRSHPGQALPRGTATFLRLSARLQEDVRTVDLILSDWEDFGVVGSSPEIVMDVPDVGRVPGDSEQAYSTSPRDISDPATDPFLRLQRWRFLFEQEVGEVQRLRQAVAEGRALEGSDIRRGIEYTRRLLDLLVMDEIGNYEGQWVAVRDARVIAVAETLQALTRVLRARRRAADYILPVRGTGDTA